MTVLRFSLGAFVFHSPIFCFCPPSLSPSLALAIYTFMSMFFIVSNFLEVQANIISSPFAQQFCIFDRHAVALIFSLHCQKQRTFSCSRAICCITIHDRNPFAINKTKAAHNKHFFGAAECVAVHRKWKTIRCHRRNKFQAIKVSRNKEKVMAKKNNTKNNNNKSIY